MLSGGKHKNQPEIPKISESLVRLQGLTKCLTVPLSDNVYIRSGEYHPWVEYQVSEGTAIGIRVFANAEVTIQRCFLSKGTEFPCHQHAEHEHLRILSGAWEYREDGRTITLLPGDGIYVVPETPHSGAALENTWILGISIPPMEGYP